MREPLKMEITKNYQVAELIEFKKLVLNTWPNVEFQKENDTELVVPKPILARENGLIIGGLSYILYQNPNQDGLALWVNTVLVNSSYRNQGIGTALVKFAMQEQISETALYVYTTIPNLYLKLEWSLISTEKENHVLRFWAHSVE